MKKTRDLQGRRMSTSTKGKSWYRSSGRSSEPRTAGKCWAGSEDSPASSASPQGKYREPGPRRRHRRRRHEGEGRRDGAEIRHGGDRTWWRCA